MNDEVVKSSISNFDVIYISYDEPNAEDHWADLKSKITWAKRVHGVKGFDNAHKHAANLANTTHFITVDGDNKVDPGFFDQDIEFNPHYIYSWAGENHINGLIYGNGGLKLWPKYLVHNMKTHENTSQGQDTKIDFCWDLPYFQMHGSYSTVFCNGSPFQAFRAGFREGVKLSLHRGQKVSNLNHIWEGNLKRLMIWMTVGADIINGVYAVYGARLGCYMTNLTDFDISLVANYDWFQDQWFDEWLPIIEDPERFQDDYRRLCVDIEQNLKMPIVNLGAKQSKFFKATLENPRRYGLMVSEKEAEELRNQIDETIDD